MAGAPIKLGFIGGGGIARAHATAIEQLPKGTVDVVGVATRSLQSAQPFAAELRTDAFGDVGQMLDQAKPDAVVVCVTPRGHGSIEHQLVERGIHFLVEKPLALDAHTAPAVEKALEGTGLIAAAGFDKRHWSAVDDAKRELAGEFDGKQKQVGFGDGFWLTKTPPLSAAWWNQLGPMGQVIEQVIHILDLERYVVGEPVSVSCISFPVRPEDRLEGNVNGSSAVHLGFANGAIGDVKTSHLYPKSFKVGLDVVCSDRTLLEIRPTGLTISRADGTQSVLPDTGSSMFRQMKSFISAIQTNDPSKLRSTYQDAVRTQNLAVGAAESALSGGTPRPL